ncbi:hypothetical protein BRAS3809_1840002 [Bradyrhizobium sp. STM 3809]|nr:hypothetical protein BRAS3809_1840002 [Bradyrhizobium sp. STM 3809]
MRASQPREARAAQFPHLGGAQALGEQVGLAVAWIAGDFVADPIGKRDDRGFARQFDFGDDDALERAVVDVDLPDAALTGHVVACLLHDTPLAMREDRLGMVTRDLVFELLARETAPAALHAQRRAVAVAADADLETVLTRDETVAKVLSVCRMIPPGIGPDEKLPFDFERHDLMMSEASPSGYVIAAQRDNHYATKDEERVVELIEGPLSELPFSACRAVFPLWRALRPAGRRWPPQARLAPAA